MPPGEADPQADRRADQGALDVAAHDPLGRAQEQSRSKPATVGNSRKFAHRNPASAPDGHGLDEERLHDHPGHEGPQPAGEAEVEVAGVEHPEDPRLRLHLGHGPVHHRLLVEEGIHAGRVQVVGGQPERFVRARRGHGPGPPVQCGCLRGLRDPRAGRPARPFRSDPIHPPRSVRFSCPRGRRRAVPALAVLSWALSFDSTGFAGPRSGARVFR